LRNAANWGFDAKVDVGTGVNPFSVTTGDFNGDGKLDMAVANFGSHTVSVLLRNAANTGFDAKVDVGTGANPRSVITGDFNNDGKLDMAVANGNSNTVSVLLRNAANTGFDVKADYGTGTAPFSMTTGDFNGDGTLDMAAANFGSHTVSVLLNTLPSATLTITDVLPNTAPTFTGGANTGLTVLEDAAITTITTAMLNVTDAEQAASALTYTLTTASTKGVLSKSGAALGVGSTFTQADINSGIIKYTPNFNVNGSDSVGFSVSDGAGGSLTAQTFNFTLTPVADVNITAGITPVEGVTGTFTITLDSAPAADLVMNYTLSASTATLTTDYTVTAGAGIGAVTAGTFIILAGQTTATLNINALTDAVTDPNETVILTLATGVGYQLAATPSSAFEPIVHVFTSANPASVTTGDFNGDGKLDMAVANWGANTVSVLLRNAANTGFDANDFATGASPYSVTTGDFNGDGKLDMAVANF
ncbi:MAG: FG-GAP-like repeat-containing protein, partial [Methylococcales bacterium]|nr:FG-GAP-like repeat-containing protein [Methylococcales bacterium]